MTKKILLINDFAGYGKVAISAVTPILARHKYEVISLPTMIVSNTLNYGKFASIDTTEYMKEAYSVWKELGFKFDAVSTGFIANDAQAEFVLKICREMSKDGAVIFTDPIMGDNGKLYNSINQKRVDIMKKIISAADVIFPNITEACYLSDIPYSEEGFDETTIEKMLRKLHDIGAESVIITSVPLLGKNGSTERAVVGYDHKKETVFEVKYDEIPVKINGSGDTFSAFVMVEILNGSAPEEAARKAVTSVNQLISDNLDIACEYNGLPVEATF